MSSTSLSFYDICSSLDRHAKERADKLALRFLHEGDVSGRVTELTFAAFRERALAVAAALQERLEPGSRALLLYEGGIDFIIAFYGCLYAGVIAVPTYPPDMQRIHRTLPRLQAIVEDAGATLVLCTSDLKRAAESLCAQVAGLRSLQWFPTDTIEKSADAWRTHVVKAEDVAYLQYTSGSTGTPKGVVVSHDNIAWMCSDFFARWPYDEHAHHVSWLPTFHDLGLLWGLVVALVGGFPVTYMLPTAFLQRPARWLEAISHFKGTHTAAPNFGFELCLTKIADESVARLDLSSMRAALNAAEPVRPSTIEAFRRKFGPAGFRPGALCPCYGLAETTLQVTLSGPTFPAPQLPISARALEQNRITPPLDEADTHIAVGCGRIASFTRLTIVDLDSRKRLEDNQVGEIWIAGPIVTQGYWGRKEATAETFDNRIPGEGDTPWLRTGDLGFVRNGELFITGRVKDMLIIRGRNLYPQDLELEVERAHQAVRPGCVTAFPIDVDGEECVGVVAEIEPARLAGSTPEALLQPLRSAIAEAFDVQVHDLALVPPRGIFKTSSGKLERRRTRQALASGALEVLARLTMPRQTVTPVARGPVLTATDIEAKFRGWFATVPGLVLPDGPIEDISFRELGLDSSSAVGISGQLAEALGRSLPPTLLFEHPTLRDLVAYLTGRGRKSPSAPVLPARPSVAMGMDEPIAIIGMGCRLPGGADTPDALFDMLCRGVDTVRRIPDERWSRPELRDAAPAMQRAALLDQVDQFDAAFFGISPREAKMVDPQQRFLLETVWEALEDAGQIPDRLLDSATGVFIGLCTSDYTHLVLESGVADLHSLVGTMPSSAAGRISHALGLQGPSMNVDTACSSSLVAVHVACQSLRLGECDMALAGGANVILAADVMHMLAKSQALAPDGRSKTFDASANGYGRGEGCGILVLKRLSDALRDGDPIRACIRGSATNHNARSGGLTVPSVTSQQALLRQALANARVAPEEVDYVETHGTGTPLGDPIEFEALRAVYGTETSGAPCVLGAIKTNVGHMEAAAGIAGLIKVVACLQREAIPGNLHLKTLNPRISLQGTRFQLPSATVPWPSKDRPRFAGVSSFGLSGTNAHVVVEEAPRHQPVPAREEGPHSYVLPISAKTPAALSQLAQAFAAHIDRGGADLQDITYTASCRRMHFEHRLAVVGDNAEEMARKLRTLSSDVQQGRAQQPAPEIVFVFSGQGSQWAGMGRALLRESPVFREAVEQCARHFEALGGFSLLAELAKPESTSALHRTEVAQPALFAIQIGLLAELRAFGVEPALVIGHSVGEVAAAHAAGILTLERACALVLARGRAMMDLAGQGQMVAVELNEQEANEALKAEAERVSIAALNGPRSVVLAGETDALHRVVAYLKANGVVCRELRVDYAFHSPQMAQAEQAFLRSAVPISPQRATVRMLSTVTLAEVWGPELSTEYWGRNIRQPVRFAEAIQQACQERGRIFLEVGPHPVLCADIAGLVSAQEGIALPSLRRNMAERAQLLAALAALHVRGVDIRWSTDFRSPTRVAPLPTYPWQRERFWVPASRPQPKPAIASDYYDSITKIVHDRHDKQTAQSVYLTFAPFAQVVPDFSWMQVFLRPQDHHGFMQLMLQKQLEMRQVLFRHVDFGACARALDFGCGFSTDLLTLAEQHPHLKLDGYSISPAQADFGQRRLRERNLEQRVQVYCRDSAADAFPGQYDLIFGFEVAHHIKDKGALFANISSHLQPHGTLVLADFISHVAFEIEHAASSSFFLTVDQWTELLSVHDLEVQDVVDASRQISNFLHDPRFDEHLSELRAKGEDENVLVSFQSYDRLGKMLDRGLGSYILLAAKKAEGKSADALRKSNRAALTNLLPYTAPASEETRDRELLYGVEWRPSALPDVEARGGETWLVVARQPETTEPLSALLSQQGIRCVRAHAAARYKPIGADEYQLDLSSPAAYSKLLLDVFGHEKPCARAVYLGALDLAPLESSNAEELGDALTEICGEAVALVQSLALHGFRQVPRLYLVTQGAQAVAGRGPLRVAHAPLWGLGKTVALEQPSLRCTRLDLDAAVAVDPAALLREVSASGREDQVALRGDKRFVTRLVRAPSVKGLRDVAIRGDRSYLITGGLGGLGLELSRWLLEQGAGRVVLAGRTEPDAFAQQALREMNGGGIRVLSVQADVSQEEQVAKLLGRIAETDKPLAGIVHAAGILRDQTLLELSKANIRSVLEPKTLGAWNLHRLAPEGLDFFVMYSSAASLCGSPGQSNYSAANAFLDALAEQRVSQGLPGMSIQWGAFAEVGMATRQTGGTRVARRGLASLSPSEGHQVLQALLRHPRATVGVMRFSARQWFEAIPSAAGLPFFSDLAKHVGSADQWKNEATQLLASLRAAREADRLPLLLPYLQQQFGAVLQQDLSRVDILAPFQSLGVDSLMSLELRNLIEAGLGVRLSATVLFTYTNLTRLALHILEYVGLDTRPVSVESQRVEQGLMKGSEIDRLSDEDLARMAEDLLR